MTHSGRPRKKISSRFSDTKHIIHEITFFVDTVMSWLYILRVPDKYEIGERMKQRLIHECKCMTASRKRIKKDIEAYHRVKDELSQLERREKRVNNIIGVLGMDTLKQFMDEDKNLQIALDATVEPTPKQLRENLALWEAMQEYLQHVPEARIAEMEEFFGAVGMPNANRQAMESALKRHPETFKVRKDKRDKHISLKSSAREGA